MFWRFCVGFDIRLFGRILFVSFEFYSLFRRSSARRYVEDQNSGSEGRNTTEKPKKKTDKEKRKERKREDMIEKSGREKGEKKKETEKSVESRLIFLGNFSPHSQIEVFTVSH